MIDLYDSATLANTTPFIDTYGTAVIYGNILLYNDSTRSGSSAGRRILKFAPETIIPNQKTLTNQLTGEIFLLAEPEFDAYRGKLIRAKYPALKAKVASLASMDDLLTTATGTALYVDVNYLKRTMYEDKAEFDHGVYIYFSNYYAATFGSFVKVGSNYYKTRSDSRVDELGLHVVEAVLLDDPVSSVAVVVKNDYDAVNDVDDTTPYADVTIVTEPSVLDFVNVNRSYAKIEPGDKTISVSKTAVPSLTVGSTMGNYTVVSVTDMTTLWSCHCRI